VALLEADTTPAPRPVKRRGGMKKLLAGVMLTLSLRNTPQTARGFNGSGGRSREISG
jgi:hypothetical protein